MSEITLQPQKITEISLDNLKKFEGHPFKEYTGNKLEEMVNSIKEHGILSPIIVRPVANEEQKYEIIAGHNRFIAAKEAGFETIPAIIKEMDDNTAIIYMIESNFQQRQEILPSEKGFAYKMQLEALKRQGKRNDLITSGQVGTKSAEAGEIVAEANDDSKRQVHRYIRLTELIPEFLEAVDNKEMVFSVAVNISYLSKKEQELLSKILNEKKVKLSIKQSSQLKIKSEDNKLKKETILEILQGELNEKPNKPHTTIEIPFKSVAKHFEGKNLNKKEINKIIVKALELYYSQNEIESIVKESLQTNADENS